MNWVLIIINTLIIISTIIIIYIIGSLFIEKTKLKQNKIAEIKNKKYIILITIVIIFFIIYGILRNLI